MSSFLWFHQWRHKLSHSSSFRSSVPLAEPLGTEVPEHQPEHVQDNVLVTPRLRKSIRIWRIKLAKKIRLALKKEKSPRNEDLISRDKRKGFEIEM